LENWEFADDVVEAVANQNDLAREEIETADLCDIVAIAVLMAPLSTDLAGLQPALQGLPAVQRLGLDEATVSAVIMQFDEEISALHEALA
jgi:HD-like signal output (HDOD) protein